MSDVAELGFLVRTDGLKAGTAELDKLNKTAKQTEDQAKKTGDALSKSGDGAKKLGQDSKTAAEGEAAMSKQAQAVADSLDKQIVKMQLTSAEYRVLQALQKAGTTLDTDAGRAIAARALALDASLAGTRRAAVGNTELGSALSALFPTMTATTTATRAMAVAKGEAAVSAGALSAALNAARPAVAGFGGAVGQLPAVAAAARLGLVGVGAAATGGALVGLAKAADEAERVRARFNAMTGSANAGDASLGRLKDQARSAGTDFNTMAGFVEKAMGGLNQPRPVLPGVVDMLGQSRTAAEKLASQLTGTATTVDNFGRAAHASGDDVKRVFDALGDSFGKTRTLSAEAFQQIIAASQPVAEKIAQAFNAPTVQAFLNRLRAAPVSVEQFATAMDRAAASAKEQADNVDSVERAIGRMGAQWTTTQKQINDTAGFDVVGRSIDGVTGFIKAMGDGLTGLINVTKAAGQGAITFDFQYSDAVKDVARNVDAAAATIVGRMNAIGQSAIDAAAAIANAIGQGLTASPAGGPAQGFPSLSDTGDVTGVVGEGGDNGAIISDIMRNVTGNAKGNAFAGGRIIPMAKGKVVTAPEFFPMADGAFGLRGEAGPEAVMPLGRTSSGDLGVKIAGAARPDIPFDPVDDIENALKDQTQELRTAIGDSGDNVSTRLSKKLDDVIAAIEDGNILLKDWTTKSASTGSGSLANAIGDAGAVQQFGQSAAAGDGSGRYTLGESFAPTGMTMGGPTSPIAFGTKLVVSGGSSSSRPDIAEELGFYNAWGGGKAAGGGDDLRGSGGGSGAPPVPNLPYGGGGGGSRSGGSGETSPGGYFGQYSDPTIAPPIKPSTSSGGYLGAGASTATNYDYGSDTSYTNYNQIGGPYPVDQNTMMATDYVSSGDFEYYGGYATGGDFTVGGSGGTDSQLVAFHGTPGEHVSVRPDGDDGHGGSRGGGIGDVHVMMNIKADDAQSILKNKHTIVGELARSIEDYYKRR